MVKAGAVERGLSERNLSRLFSNSDFQRLGPQDFADTFCKSRAYQAFQSVGGGGILLKP
jgi:hypothetical protein